jgi:4'-phosphopantetheinyl transferase
VPEIFRNETNEGFVSIWQLKESPDFFCSGIETESVLHLQNKFENLVRLKEKFAPHHILKKFNPELILNNLDRKPRVNSGYVSISHCKDFVAVNYNSNHTVGIDIEYYGDRILKILHKFLNAQEDKFCDRNTTKCLIIWAAKEALFKKFGGDTAFFKENIHVDAFPDEKQTELSGTVHFEGKKIQTKLNCTLFEEFVMVHTI